MLANHMALEWSWGFVLVSFAPCYSSGAQDHVCPEHSQMVEQRTAAHSPACGTHKVNAL